MILVPSNSCCCYSARCHVLLQQNSLHAPSSFSLSRIVNYLLRDQLTFAFNLGPLIFRLCQSPLVHRFCCTSANTELCNSLTLIFFSKAGLPCLKPTPNDSCKIAASAHWVCNFLYFTRRSSLTSFFFIISPPLHCVLELCAMSDAVVIHFDIFCRAIALSGSNFAFAQCFVRLAHADS